MSSWSDVMSESNMHNNTLSISPSSDMFTSQQLLHAASPSALSVVDDKELGFREGSSVDPAKTESVEEAADIDPPTVVDPVALESFAPLLKVLNCPGLTLINGAYHLRGAVRENGSLKLFEYARRVTKFTLGHTGPRPAEARIDAATWFRVLQLHSRHSQSSTAFFPSLTEVCINRSDGANDRSLDQIFLLLSPSLKSVDISNFHQTRSDTLLTFLENVAEVAPGLSHIGVDTSLSKSLFSHDLQDTYMKFTALRSLRITINRGSRLSYDALVQIGELSLLETLVLDASDDSYYDTKDTHPTPYLEPKEDDLWENSWGGVPVQHTSVPSFGNRTPSPTTPIPDIEPPFGYRAPSPTPSIPDIGPDAVPAVPGSAANRLSSRGVGFQNLAKLHVKGRQALMIDLVRMITSTKVVDVSLTETRDFSPTPVMPPPQVPAPKTKKNGKGPDKTPTAVIPPAQLPFVECFDDIIKEIISAWGHSLQSVYIARAQDDIALPPNLHPIPSHSTSALFKCLISISSLERLEISGDTWNVNFGDLLQFLTTTLPVDRRSESKLKVIHLPINAGDNGISFNRLRAIFECCPSLVSFQCGFKHLSNIPAPPSDGVTFGLQKLRAGNAQAYGPDYRRFTAVAQYLDALFSCLTIMETEASCNAGEWEDIYSLVRMCQASRSYHKHG